MVGSDNFLNGMEDRRPRANSAGSLRQVAVRAIGRDGASGRQRPGLSMVAAILALRATGAAVNTMVLAGFAIALGAVVDDAIIDIENIVRRLRENRRLGSPKSTFMVIVEVSLEIRRAAVHATLIIVLAPCRRRRNQDRPDAQCHWAREGVAPHRHTFEAA